MFHFGSPPLLFCRYFKTAASEYHTEDPWKFLTDFNSIYRCHQS